jgi:hypothetical protein
MQTLYFVVIGIALYFSADWLLNRIERARGERFAHREIIYFAIILTLTLATFYFINRFGTGAA